MARKISVLNMQRNHVSLGAKNIPPAKGNPTPTVVDFEDGRVRKDWANVGHRLAIVGHDGEVKRAIVPLVAGVATGGGVFAWQNPEGRRIHVLRVDLDVTTAATGAATVDVGTTPTSATTSSDNLIDGKDVNAATGLFSSIDDTDNGTNGVAKGQTLASGKWVTGSRASGATAGLVGNAIITYTVAE